MQVGDKFVLNVLGESTYEPVMKHFLKRFAAGADRFEVRPGLPAAGWPTPAALVARS